LAVLALDYGPGNDHGRESSCRGQLPRRAEARRSPRPPGTQDDAGAPVISRRLYSLDGLSGRGDLSPPPGRPHSLATPPSVPDRRPLVSDRPAVTPRTFPKIFKIPAAGFSAWGGTAEP